MQCRINLKFTHNLFVNDNGNCTFCWDVNVAFIKYLIGVQVYTKKDMNKTKILCPYNTTLMKAYAVELAFYDIMCSTADENNK